MGTTQVHEMLTRCCHQSPSPHHCGDNISSYWRGRNTTEGPTFRVTGVGGIRQRGQHFVLLAWEEYDRGGQHFVLLARGEYDRRAKKHKDFPKGYNFDVAFE